MTPKRPHESGQLRTVIVAWVGDVVAAVVGPLGPHGPSAPNGLLGHLLRRRPDDHRRVSSWHTRSGRPSRYYVFGPPAGGGPIRRRVQAVADAGTARPVVAVERMSISETCRFGRPVSGPRRASLRSTRIGQPVGSWLVGSEP